MPIAGRHEAPTKENLLASAPTGKTITASGITIIRIVDGKVVEDRFEAGGPTIEEQLKAA